MNSLKNTLMDRIVAILLVVAVVFTSLPMNPVQVIATEGETVLQSDTITYSGTVTDKDGNGIAGVTVSLTSQTENALCESTTTDDTGAYSLTLTSGADYILTFAMDGYGAKEVSLTADQTTSDVTNDEALILLPLDASFAFSESEITVVWGNTIPENVATSANQPDATVRYESSDNAVATVDEATGVVTAVSVGDVIISAVIEENDSYAETKTKYQLHIKGAAVEGFAFESQTVTRVYNPDKLTFSYQVQNPDNIENPITYSILSEQDLEGKILDAGTVASIDAASGDVTILRSGIVVVQAHLDAGNGYEETDATYTLTIQKAQQDALVLDGVTADEVVNLSFDDFKYVSANTYALPNVTGGAGSGAISYAVTDETGADVAEYAAFADSAVGQLTIKKPWADTIVLTVTKAGDDCYEQETIAYKLTMIKATQNAFAFVDGTDGENGKTVSFLYGEKTEYVNAISLSEEDALLNKGYSSSDIKYTYTLLEGTEGNGIVKAFDETTGKITFADGVIGSVTVTAVKAEDEYYQESLPVSYTLSVSYGETPDNPVTLDGTKKEDSCEWYNSEVKIIPADGYYISESNSLDSAVWQEFLTHEETKAGGVQVYLKSIDTGVITDAVSVGAFQIDKDAPTVNNIKYIVPATESILETITFGLYTPKCHVTISASDANSGMDYFSYYISTEDGQNSETTRIPVYMADGTLSDGITIDEMGRVSYSFRTSVENSDRIRFTATDIAGNPSAEVTAGDIEQDGTAPQVKVQLFHESDLNTELSADDICTNSSITALVTVTEKNFVSEYITIEVLKNGTSIELSEENGISCQTSSQILNDETVWTKEITFAYDGEYTVIVTAEDCVGNQSTENEDSTKAFEIDKTPAEIKETYAGYATVEGAQDTGFTYYYPSNEAGEVIIPVEISEKNFSDDKVTVLINKDGVENQVFDMVWEQDTTDGNIWRSNVKLSGEGIHSFTVQITDIAGNSKIYQSQTIVIDDTDPEVTLELFTETYETPEGYLSTLSYESNYDETILVKVTVRDENIAPANTIFNANGSWEYVGDWQQAGDSDKEYFRYVKFTTDNIYDVQAKAVDKAGNESVNFATKHFVVDQTPVQVADMTISYSEPYKWLETLSFGYYQSYVEVTLSATDNLTGIDMFEWTYTRESGSSEKNVETKTGSITVGEKAFVENGKSATATFRLTASEAEQFRGSVKFTATDKAGKKSQEKLDGSRISVVDNISPLRTVTYSTAYKVLDKTTYQPIENYQYSAEGTNAILYYDGSITATFEVKEINFYPEDTVIKVNGEEQSTSDWTKSKDTWKKSITLTEDGEYLITMEYEDRSGNEMAYYSSELLVIDTIAPSVRIDMFDKNGNASVSESNENYFNEEVYAQITVNDATFVEDDAVIMVNDQKVTSPTWSKTQTVDEWTVKVPLITDNCYDVQVSVTDCVDKSANGSQMLWIDKTKPGADRMSIEYSGELSKWEKVLNAITFGYYAYAREVEVTLTAWDDMSGIDYFTWSYIKEGGTSDVNAEDKINNKISGSQLTFSEDGKKAVGTFKLKASELEQFRGNISFTATDRANNSSVKNDNQRINIVDNISPTRRVIFSQARQVVDAVTMQTKAEYQYDAENTSSILYYDGDVTVAFEITEANFYKEDVIVKVNDKHTTAVEWKQNKDIWTGTLVLSGDGEYIVTMEYTDRSNNAMLKYTSERIIIDTVLPEIEVVYGNNNIQNSYENRNYYNDTQTATITITERNFRASDVVATVTAKDVEGTAIDIANYMEYLSNKDNWKRNGDSYTAYVTYSTEGNYEFDIAYCDLAKHDIIDYQTDYFTVDRTAPQNITISYSQSLLEQIIEAITFGFYDANVIVTVQAEDTISGISEIRYSAIRAAGVSGVNTEVIDAVLTENEIERSGKEGKAEIRVPGSELGENSQFNGTFECKLSDRSKNTVESNGDRRLVVDNIAPNITVTSTEPVKEVNEIAYYDGNITITMEVNEANFYPEEFKLLVTRDGTEVVVSPSWVDESADMHVGTFTLQEDGEYLITIDYVDKSNNQMEQYKSKKMTIDTEEPIISVSAIRANEASKEEVFGFTITAEDTNIDAALFEPLLEAVLQDENGNFYRKEMDLGAVQVIDEGSKYAYVVDNLEEDAIYTLSCSVADMANHTKNLFVLEDGNEYENVQFSINRQGSNFRLSQDTETLVENYYIYDVNNDVVIEEINVNPVETYAVKLNGVLLEEGKEDGFETELTGGADEWSKRTYVIDKSLFKDEGIYNIVIESIDITETVAYSDIKNAAVEFVVDQNPPLVTLSGLENGGTYETDEQEVIVMPTDEGGKLHSFTAVVFDSQGMPLEDSTGNDISNRISLEGEELLTHLAENDGTITFTIPEGLNLQVQIICTDCAVHSEDGSTNEYNQIFERITVTQSGLLMFYANKPLFYGTVAGITVPTAGIIAFVLRRRRKIKIK